MGNYFLFSNIQKKTINYFEKCMHNRKKVFIFFLFSLPWMCVVWIRNCLYDFHILKIKKIELPVISIGGIGTGGSGKTQIVIWCAQLLHLFTYTPLILSRGYGRIYQDICIVKDQDDMLQRYGDECAMMKKKLDNPVLLAVGKNRYETFKFVKNKNLIHNIDCCILDDGFQHRRLFRDLDIVILNDLTLGLPYMLPYGYLREPFSRLNRASCILFKSTEDTSILFKQFHILVKNKNIQDPIAQFYYRIVSLQSQETGETFPSNFIHRKNIIICSGIADPENFEQLVKNQSPNIQGIYRFSDHHCFLSKEFSLIVKKAMDTHSAIVLTDKDAVRIPEKHHHLVFSVQIDIAWVFGKQDLESQIFKIVSHKHSI